MNCRSVAVFKELSLKVSGLGVNFAWQLGDTPKTLPSAIANRTDNDKLLPLAFRMASTSSGPSTTITLLVKSGIV